MQNNHAFRGKDFEARLNSFCSTINANGGFAHKLQPSYKNEHGKNITIGEPFDYIIAVPGELHCFEAKSTYENKWYIRGGSFYAQTYNRRERAQLTRIKLALGENVMCYFLVWFKQFDKVIRFDTSLINAAVEGGIKGLLPEDGIPWHPQDILSKCPGYDITRFIAGDDSLIPPVRHSERTLTLWPNGGDYQL